LTSAFERQIPPELRIEPQEVVGYLVPRLKRYLEEHSESGAAVMGLSGGVDSSVAACLTVKAVGVAKAHFYYLPSESTSAQDERDMRAMVKLLKVPKRNFREMPIDPLVKAYGREMGLAAPDRLLLGNMKARIRMVLLYAFAQKHGALVVGTGDKSELTVGYFTKFGDGGVDVLPLGDLFKTQVRQLAAHLGLPKTVYTKPPTPGLWKDQSAEGELGIDYFLLDRILFHRFDLREDEASIARTVRVPKKKVDEVVRLVKRTQHKRYPPEIFRVSYRSHGSDWRYPREWR
jgi:NAD+ synthase